MESFLKAFSRLVEHNYDLNCSVDLQGHGTKAYFTPGRSVKSDMIYN